MPTDFEVFGVKKQKGIKDHRGNYITSTGHRIDDYTLKDTTVLKKELKMRLSQMF